MKIKFFYSFLCVLFCGMLQSPLLQAQGLKALQDELAVWTNSKKADIGIAVILNGKDTLTVNNEGKYPMMSVFKFHQALAVAHYLESHHISLDSALVIDQTELRKDTYSPLRDKHPGGISSVSLRELLEYTLLLSDNNACDILFNRILNVGETDSFIRSLGIKDFSIVVTEKDMKDNPDLCYANWSTPLAAVQLLDQLLYNKKFLQGEYRKFIIDTMLKCKTGQDRIPRYLRNENVTIGHKTGSGDVKANGETIAINDIGFVSIPGGQQYTIAVFIRDSKESFSGNEAIIADISKMVYSFVRGRTAQR